jgi:probable F420-dependent oxidoreductase
MTRWPTQRQPLDGKSSDVISFDPGPGPKEGGLKVGILGQLVSPITSPEYVATYGRAAEAYGVHRIWLPDPHIVQFANYSSDYPYSNRADKKQVVALDDPDEFPTLAFLAAVTSTVRLATCICVVPQRNPLYTAKAVTTVDHLSNGRFDFGVGIGWNEDEFAAAGVPFARREARCREYLQLMFSLWTDPVSSFSGDFYAVPPCRQDPKPVQKPYPPIFFGGESDRALRMVADMGQGWVPVNLGPERISERVRRLVELLEERGRRREEIEICASPFPAEITPETLEAYAESGVDEIAAWMPMYSQDEIEPKLEALAGSVIEPASRLG